MKRLSFILALCFTMGFNGCEKKVSIQKEQKVLTKPVTKSGSEKTVFMTGEKDTFNPQSDLESIRKKRLTPLGRINNQPPVITPDIEKTKKVFNKTNYDFVNVAHLGFEPLEIPSYPFDYENDIQALKNLQKLHNLNNMFKSKMNELDLLGALMVYTYNFLDGGTPPPPELSSPSAEVITKLRLEKGIGGTSEHYAALFCQFSLSYGFNSRIISMHTIDEKGEILPYDVCEVFLNSFNKWVVFDAFAKATYYLRDEIPQSALEIRRLMLDNLYRDLTPVILVGDFTDIISVREKLLPRYRYIYMWRMNDILGKSKNGTPIPWQALYQYHLVWEDEYALIKDGGFDRIKKFNDTSNPQYPLNGVRYVTHEKSDFYCSLNHVTVSLTRPENNTLRIYMDTLTPNFDHFEISIDEAEGGMKTYIQPKHFQDINFVYLDIYVKSHNSMGLSGPQAHIILSK